MIGIKELRKIRREIISRYLAGESTHSMAKKFHTYPIQINRILKECQTQLRPANNINDKAMSDSLCEIIDGWLLGDGNITSVGNQAGFSLCSKYEEYIDYAIGLFDKENISSKKYIDNVYYRMRTLSTVQFGELYQKWYKNKIKIVPNDIVITPLLVQHWIMDDGTYSQDKGHLRLCTNGFAIEECDFLADKLNQFIGTIDIHTIEREVNKTRIYLSKQNTNKLYDKIGSLPVSCFSYKMRKYVSSSTDR